MILADLLNAECIGAVGRGEQVATFSIGRQVSHALCQGRLGKLCQVPAFGVDPIAQHLERLDPQGCKQHFAVRGEGHGIDLITGLNLFNKGECAVVLIEAVLRDETVTGA